MKKVMMVVVGLMLALGGYGIADDMKGCKDCGMADCKMDHSQGMHGKGMMKDKMMGQMSDECRFVTKVLKMKKDLNLTKQQEDSLEKIGSDYKKLAIQKEADIKVASMEFMESMKKETPDFVSAKANAKKASDLKAALKLSMIEAHEQAYNILTKEQQQKVSSMKEDKHEERKEKMMEHKMMGK